MDGQSSACVRGEAATPDAVACSSSRPRARPACNQEYRSSPSVPIRTTVGRSTSGGGASGSPGSRNVCCSRWPTMKSRISQLDGRACGSPLGTASTGTPSTAPGSVRKPALQLGPVGGVALLHLLGSGDQEDRRDL